MISTEGTYVPITGKDNELLIDLSDIVDDRYEAFVDAPSLVTPLLLKKKSDRASLNTVQLEQDTQKPDTVEDDLVNKCESRRSIEESIKSATMASLTQLYKTNKPVLVIDDYYKTPAGEMLLGIGLSRVTEFNLEYAAKKIKSKIKKGSTELISELELIEEELLKTKGPNKIFGSDQLLKCPRCFFKSESSTVMTGHLEEPHYNSKREYMCNWCDYKVKDSNQIVFHNMIEHKKRCRIEKPPALHLCCYCPYECKSKRKMTSHLFRCEKSFKHNSFLGPQEFDENEYPAITSKLISKEDVNMYEKTLKTLRQVMNPSSSMDSYNQPTSASNQNHLNIPGTLNAFAAPSNLVGANLSVNNQLIQDQNGEKTTNRVATLQYPRTHSQFVNGKAVIRTASDFVSLPSSQIDHLNSTQLSSLVDPEAAGMREKLPQNVLSGDALALSQSPNPKGSTFVICEICDGYIKDLSSLKTHMQWIHKVKIHQKMLISRPPLNCQKCQWRFFTDQGLERHLLGAHGLVTSNMQELVDQGVDGGRCTVCGRAYASKLVAHMKEVHKSSLKPAHLSYKCTVCSATFNLYRLFENHVYSVHTESIKRVSSN